MKQNILLGYRRKSLVRGKTDLVSPERQARQCELWVQMQDADYIIEWYEDIEGHRSGRDEKNRPGWQELMKQLNRPEVTGVIADSFDRMYRNVQQFLNFLNHIEKIDKKLITVKEGMDTSSTMGRAIVTILMVIYQLESDQTSERMKANIKYKREQLGRHWGTTPFGCDRDDDAHLIPTQKTYWLNPITGQATNGDTPPDDHWEQRRYYDALMLIYETYAIGSHSYDSITKILNESGWRYIGKGKNPRMFDRDDVRRAIHNWQLFRGDLPTGTIKRFNGGVVLAGGHQPILPVELCNRVGQVLDKRSSKYNVSYYRTKNRTHLLSNILHCGTCGKKLKGATDHGKSIYRHVGAKDGCPEKQVFADDLERDVIAKLTELVETTFLNDIVDESKNLMREAFSQDDAGQARLAELDRQQKKLRRLEDLYLDEEIDREHYSIKRSEIKEIISRIEDELYAVSQLGNINAVIDRLVDSISELGRASPETQKALINSVFERLDLVGGKIRYYTPRPWARGFF